LAYPKIMYDAGAGPVTLLFSYPPVEKPGPHDGHGDDRQAQRMESITLSGRKQIFYIRTDKFRNLHMKFVPNEDLVDWSAFMDYALTGGQFDYYPDADVGTFTTYTLEDMEWKPERAFFGFVSFDLTMRQFV
jgi:hypothetical protein